MLEFDEFFANPAKLGLPTFDEYKRNPQYYREKMIGRDDDNFATIDKADTRVKPLIRKQKYFLDGMECKSLEDVERIAKMEGTPINQLTWKPELIPHAGGSCDVHINFKSPLIPVFKGAIK